MRHICLDTETTGLSPDNGDKIVEIACVELINLLPTGNIYHQYVNPKRDVPRGAFEVHGLSYDFLKDFPTFDKIADDFLHFIGDAPLVIHNATFDLKFLNAELSLLKKALFLKERAIDTLMIARKKFPGSPASLDSLCKKFGVSLSKRVKHGALTDTELLAEVFLHLSGGREPGLNLKNETKKNTVQRNVPVIQTVIQMKREVTLSSSLTEIEQKNHMEFIKKELKNSMWEFD